MFKSKMLYATLYIAVIFPLSAHAEEVTIHEGRSIAVAPVAGVKWAGFAASPNGRVFQANGSDESQSKAMAKEECEQHTARTCRVIAVPASWNVSAVSCGRSTFLGASEGSAATWIARRKAEAAGFYSNDCREIYTY